jgi:hypothetical protein
MEKWYMLKLWREGRVKENDGGGEFSYNIL